MPERASCVIPALLEHYAALTPDKTLVLFEDGSEWTYGETLDRTRSAAAGLRKLGVDVGDTVLAWLPNGPDMLLSWFAANYLGAILVPINTSYRGKLLEHVIRQSDATLMIGHAELLPRLRQIDATRVESVLCCNGGVDTADLPDGLTARFMAEVTEASPPVESAYPVERWDTMMIIYTSGTTGPSKGVLTTYLQQYTVGQVSFGYMTDKDRMLVNLPMFHVGGTTAIVGMLSCGGSFALRDKFQTAQFWQQIRDTGATGISGFLGAMVAFLDKNEPRADDPDNPLERVVLSPVTAQTMRLAERYGFDYFSGFNMTEISVPLVTELNTRVQSSCGKPRSGVECRIVDEHDLPVDDGVIGEFVLRCDLPWAINQGYHGMPEESLKAWRNGWFHTGDLMYRDEAGNYFFVDRKKDAIRRRGENISSIEVEAEVAEFPAVAEVAVFGVPSEYGEDEVMAVVAGKPDMDLDPKALIEFLVPRIAHFMVPRYLRVLAELPKTPTNKVQKTELRDAGVTADTWDREAAGIRLRKDQLN
ncbi:MAG: AMP-binding protein [Gammaproteobacteria bacterium]|nr:AMP-binding protein [Gammaproteobacteria bacterium]